MPADRLAGLWGLTVKANALAHAYMQFGKRKEKREQAQQPPSLHARLDTPNSWKVKKEENEPIVSLHEKSDKPNSGKTEIKSLAVSFHGRSVTPNSGEKGMSLPQYVREKEKRLKKKEKEEEKDEEKSLEASHPSMKGQRLQEHWVGTTGNHRRRTRCPEMSLLLQSASPVTDILAVGWVIKNRYLYGAAQTPTRLLRRQMFRTPVCNELTTPKFRSKSIVKPQLTEMGDVHQQTLHGQLGYSQ